MHAGCLKRLLIRLPSLADPTPTRIVAFTHHLLEVTDFHLKLLNVFPSDVESEDDQEKQGWGEEEYVTQKPHGDHVEVEKVFIELALIRVEPFEGFFWVAAGLVVDTNAPAALVGDAHVEGRERLGRIEIEAVWIVDEQSGIVRGEEVAVGPLKYSKGKDRSFLSI